MNASGNLFISDTLDFRIRKVCAANGVITTVAGYGDSLIFSDGGLATATGLVPTAIAVDASGNLFLTDGGRIRAIRAVDTIPCSPAWILAVTSLTSATSGTSGGSLPGVAMNVANLGTAPAPPFRVEYFYSQTPSFTSGAIDSGQGCNISGGLAAGKSLLCTGDIGVPSTVTPGTWYLFAVADDQNLLPQTDRSGSVLLSQSGSITIQ